MFRRPSKKSEREDAEAAENLIAVTEAMSDRRVLKRFLSICVAANLILWVVSTGLADWVYFLVSPVITDKIGVLLLGVPLALGMYITYSLFRLKLPDIEDNKQLDSDMMASFVYQADSTKRWFVWLFSALGGVLNTLLLILSNVFFAGEL